MTGNGVIAAPVPPCDDVHATPCLTSSIRGEPPNVELWRAHLAHRDAITRLSTAAARAGSPCPGLTRRTPEGRPSGAKPASTAKSDENARAAHEALGRINEGTV
jgi:hypothetical protein